MALKYVLLVCLVLVGAFAYSKRDDVFGAFDADEAEAPIVVHGFDPAARAAELQKATPVIDALRVVNAADTRGTPVAGLPVPATTPNPKLQGGGATLAGTVSGPNGPVGGATVRIERFEGEVAASTDLVTDGSGGFTLAGTPGGRFRVRAWQAPTLAQGGSQVAFVNDGERQTFALQMDAPTGARINPDWSSGGWIIGSKPTISVNVQQPYVTSDGRVELGGRSGLPVTLTVGGTLVGNAAANTGADGSATFEVTCAAIGPATANLRIGTWTRDLTVPVCSPVPTTTTTTTTAPTTTVPGAPGTPAPTTVPAPPPTAAPAG